MSPLDTEKALWEAVGAGPESLDLLVLADFYEEHGLNLWAEALRCLVATKRKMATRTEPPTGLEFYTWWSYEIQFSCKDVPRHAMLEPYWHRMVIGMSSPREDNFSKSFYSKELGYREAVEAFALLTPEQRKACWGWNPERKKL